MTEQQHEQQHGPIDLDAPEGPPDGPGVAKVRSSRRVAGPAVVLAVVPWLLAAVLAVVLAVVITGGDDPTVPSTYPQAVGQLRGEHDQLLRATADAVGGLEIDDTEDLVARIADDDAFGLAVAGGPQDYLLDLGGDRYLATVGDVGAFYTRLPSGRVPTATDRDGFLQPYSVTDLDTADATRLD